MQDPSYIIKDLGELFGDVLLFGGPYSNLQASQALLKVAERQNIPVSNRICTGDLVAYCANPNETVELWKHQCELLAGNCEKQLGAGATDCGCGFVSGSACDRLSKDWFSFADTQLSDRNRDYLNSAPDLLVFVHGAKRYAVIHGGVNVKSQFLWPLSPDSQFSQEISRIKSAVGRVDRVVAGHCGMAFEKTINDVQWFNPGVIGMPPHDGHPETRYGILDHSGIRVEPLTYDFAQAAAAMQTAGLVQGYDTALISGYWPSQDILPEPMRRPSRGASMYRPV